MKYRKQTFLLEEHWKKRKSTPVGETIQITIHIIPLIVQLTEFNAGKVKWRVASNYTGETSIDDVAAAYSQGKQYAKVTVALPNLLTAFFDFCDRTW